MSANLYKQLGQQIGELVDRKNAAYGSSFAKSAAFLALLHERGVDPRHYGNVLLSVRIFDKLMRIATDEDAFGESPFQDIAGYGLLGAQLALEKNTNTERRSNECGSVSGSDVEELSPAPNASAAPSASEPIKMSATELSEPHPGSKPKPSSPDGSVSADAFAPRATEAARSGGDASPGVETSFEDLLNARWRRSSANAEDASARVATEPARPAEDSRRGSVEAQRGTELLKMLRDFDPGCFGFNTLRAALQQRGLGELTAGDTAALERLGFIAHARVRGYTLTERGKQHLADVEACEPKEAR